MTGAGDIRVLLVDDQPLIRMGFRMVLDSEAGICVVGEADDGPAAVALAQELRPDVVMMDVRMPGMDGIEATSVIVRRCPESRVIILTTFDLDEYAFAGLHAGASGFLLKNARPAELTQAIRTVAAGDAVVAPRITRRILDMFGSRLPTGEAVESVPATIDPAAPPPEAGAVARRDHRLSVLTDREFEVFAAVGRGLTNTEISAALHLSESTVKTHVGHILLKLNLRDRIHAVVLGYETGVVRPGGPLPGVR
jgi:DNA-binding NarL/FixJ family response regulator